MINLNHYPKQKTFQNQARANFEMLDLWGGARVFMADLSSAEGARASAAGAKPAAGGLGGLAPPENLEIMVQFGAFWGANWSFEKEPDIIILA